MPISLRNLLFPPRCVACDILLHPSAPLTEAFCPICRTAWEAAVAHAAPQAAEDAARGLVYLTFYRTGRPDGVPERLIYHVKHRGTPRAFAFAARRLAPRVLRAAETLPRRSMASAEADTALPGGAPTLTGTAAPILVTYPPRRPSAVRREGFDQGARLAKAVATACGGDFAPLIRRSRRARREQKALDSQGRTANAQSAYTLARGAAERVRGRVVAVCDDVCTTGATLHRCADLLVAGGAALVILVAMEKTGK